MKVNCAEHRAAQLLLALKNRLAREKLDKVEESRLREEIKALEKALGLDR